MKFREIYCDNCRKVLGRYNVEFYNEDKIKDLLKTNHAEHVRDGHHVKIRFYDSAGVRVSRV